MKRLIALVLTVLLVFSLAACGNNTETTPPETTAERKAADTETKADAASEGKTLIVYFSWSSNTETMANYIYDEIGGDMERIDPETAYPEDYNETADQAKAERDNNERPAFKVLEHNPEDYDTIFIGYPIWWYELPMIMRTFFDTYDFSGKTIVPFNTHAGSGNGGTYDQIKEEEPNATVLESLPIAGEDINNSDSKDKVIAWLSELGY